MNELRLIYKLHVEKIINGCKDLLDEYLITKNLSNKDYKLTVALRLAICLTNINDLPHIRDLKDTVEQQSRYLARKYGGSEKMDLIIQQIITHFTIFLAILMIFMYLTIKYKKLLLKYKK